MRLPVLCCCCFLFPSVIVGLPSVLIDSPKPWCVNVDGALDEALLVEYEAPGVCVCARQAAIE